MNFTNRASFTSSISAKLSGVAVIATLAGTIVLCGGAAARADVAGTTQPTQGTPAVHRMVMTPVWVTKPGSGLVVGGIATHMTTKHAVKSKIGASDVIEEPIWPVTPPPAPTDPTDGSGSGSGSGG